MIIATIASRQSSIDNRDNDDENGKNKTTIVFIMITR